MNLSKEIFCVKYKYFNGKDWVPCENRVLAKNKNEAIAAVIAEPECPKEFRDTVFITVCSPFRMGPVSLKLP